MRAICHILAVAVMTTLGAQAEEKISVLIVTGQNNHDWFRSAPMIESLLEETGRFQVSVSTTPSEEAPEDAWGAWRPKFKDYDVVLSDYNGKMWPDGVKSGFVDYVRNGGHVVLVHAANNAFNGWKEFEASIEEAGNRDNDPPAKASAP
ncbi:MAG: ThuA domain-containing protein [Verrucomicrobiota bacterium]